MNDNRPDYFRLSLFAGSVARQVVEMLPGAIALEASRFLAEGFIVPDPAALAKAAEVFLWLETLPGGGAALSEDTVVERIHLIKMVGAHVRALEEYIDLTWCSTWANFMAGERRKNLLDCIQLSIRHQCTPAQVDEDMSHDCRVAYEQERWNR